MNFFFPDMFDSKLNRTILEIVLPFIFCDNLYFPLLKLLNYLSAWSKQQSFGEHLGMFSLFSPCLND